MFAIDGVMLPANASKAKSGTRKDFQRQAEKMEKATRQMLARHRSADAAPRDVREADREARKLERLRQEAQRVRDWLASNPDDRKRARGRGRLSNRSDRESAKMATGKGVIRGLHGRGRRRRAGADCGRCASARQRLRTGVARTCRRGHGALPHPRHGITACGATETGFLYSLVTCLLY